MLLPGRVRPIFIVKISTLQIGELGICIWENANFGPGTRGPISGRHSFTFYTRNEKNYISGLTSIEILVVSYKNMVWVFSKV